MRLSIEEFRRKYPHLAKEILDSDETPHMELSVAYRAPPSLDPWRGYVPGPIDYLRRARDEKEAREVIQYLLRHGEITSDEAKYYLDLLEEKGLEAFGPRKEGDYYYRTALEFWRRLALRERRISGGQRRQLS